MAFERKLKEEFIDKPNYGDMKRIDLKKVCDELDISIAGPKDEVIERIHQVENDTYIRPVIYETINGVYYIGIHKNDKKNMELIVTLMNEYQKTASKNGIKNDSIKKAHWASDYHYYKTSEKIKL